MKKLIEILPGIAGAGMLCEFFYHGFYWGLTTVDLLPGSIYRSELYVPCGMLCCVLNTFLLVCFGYRMTKLIGTSFERFVDSTLLFSILIFFCLESIGRSFYALPVAYHVCVILLVLSYILLNTYCRRFFSDGAFRQLGLMFLAVLVYVAIAYWFCENGYFNHCLRIEKCGPMPGDMLFYPPIFILSFAFFSVIFRKICKVGRTFNIFLSFNVVFFPLYLLSISFLAWILIVYDMLIVNGTALLLLIISFLLSRFAKDENCEPKSVFQNANKL